MNDKYSGNMRIKETDYNELKAVFTAYFREYPMVNYSKDYNFNGQHYKSYKNQGFTAERWRWNLYWGLVDKYFHIRLYEYLGDNHVDTALKRITQAHE